MSILQETPAPDEQELPPECERCGITFGHVHLATFTYQDGSTDQEMVGASLIGERWVCPDCEPAEYDDYYAELADWAAMYEDNHFESQREEAF